MNVAGMPKLWGVKLSAPIPFSHPARGTHGVIGPFQYCSIRLLLMALYSIAMPTTIGFDAESTCASASACRRGGRAMSNAAQFRKSYFEVGPRLAAGRRDACMD